MLSPTVYSGTDFWIKVKVNRSGLQIQFKIARTFVAIPSCFSSLSVTTYWPQIWHLSGCSFLQFVLFWSLPTPSPHLPNLMLLCMAIPPFKREKKSFQTSAVYFYTQSKFRWLPSPSVSVTVFLLPTSNEGWCIFPLHHCVWEENVLKFEKCLGDKNSSKHCTVCPWLRIKWIWKSTRDGLRGDAVSRQSRSSKEACVSRVLTMCA